MQCHDLCLTAAATTCSVLTCCCDTRSPALRPNRTTAARFMLSRRAGRPRTAHRRRPRGRGPGPVPSPGGWRVALQLLGRCPLMQKAFRPFWSHRDFFLLAYYLHIETFGLCKISHSWPSGLTHGDTPTGATVVLALTPTARSRGRAPTARTTGAGGVRARHPCPTGAGTQAVGSVSHSYACGVLGVGLLQLCLQAL